MPKAATRRSMILAVTLTLFGPVTGWGLTRQAALGTASEYLLIVYDVTEANVYPAIACYDPTDPDHLQKLEPGNYTGLPYSHRPGQPFTPDTIISHLYGTPARGAGNSKDFDETHPACVLNHTTGIDCSQFVSAAWHLPQRFVTKGLGPTIAARITDKNQVKAADAFNWAEHHVVLFATTVSSTTNLFTCYEANGSEGKCIVQSGQNWNDWSNRGYLAWCSNNLKDEPAADVFALSAGLRDGQAVVAWETLLERDTRGFVVERSSSWEGPFVAVSDLLAPRGSGTSGAWYEFTDTGHPGGAAFYQLREIETSGNELLHGVTGPVTPAGGAGR